MKSTDFGTETSWTWQCPECGEYNEINDDPDTLEDVQCEYCDHLEEYHTRQMELFT